MKSTREIVIGKIRIEVFGEVTHPLLVDVKQQKEILFSCSKNLKEFETLRSHYHELGLSFLAGAKDIEIASIKIDAIKESFINPSRLGYLLVPDDLRDALDSLFWVYKGLNEYRGTIPFRVLEIWKEAKDYGIFRLFTILTSREKETADNVLLAYFDQDPYILLRWGTELVPFEQLMEYHMEAIK